MGVTALGSVVDGIFGLASSLINRKSQKDTNKSNERNVDKTNALQLDMFNKQMDYTKALQQEEWSRQDSAYQRTVDDLVNAGLSPLLASGGPTSSGAIVSTPTAPHLSVAQAIAPQFDTTFISDLTRELIASDTTKSVAQASNEATRLNLLSSLESAEKQLDMQIKSNETIAENKQYQEFQQFLTNSRLSLSIADRDSVVNFASQAHRDISNLFGGDVPVNVLHDYDEWQSAYTSWWSNFMSSSTLADIENVTSSSSTSTTSGSSSGLSTNSSFGGGLGTVQGYNSGNFNLSTGHGISESSSKSNSFGYSSQKTGSNFLLTQKLQKYCRSNPYPVYYPSSKVEFDEPEFKFKKSR